jgi:WD40 repeat protein
MKNTKLGKAALLLITMLCFGVLFGCGREKPVEPAETLTETPPFVLQAELSAVTALAFSEDGAFLASGFADDSFALWQLADGERVVFLENTDMKTAAEGTGISLRNETMEPEDGATASAVNRKKTRLASGYKDGSIVLKDRANGRNLRCGSPSGAAARDG